MQTKELLGKFDFDDWHVQFSGNWPIVELSSYGPFYSRKPFSEYVGQYVNRTIIIIRKGSCHTYQRISEKQAFADKLIENIDEAKVKDINW
jgi:hypothetical protein